MGMSRRPKRPAPRVLDDPRAIRALAHPARLAALDSLSDDSELTATAIADIAGISPSAMSYHLRALEKWGLVERVESSEDGRERPWRAYPGGWGIDAIPNAAAAEATNAVTKMLLGQVAKEVERWFRHERNEADPAWRHESGLDNSRIWLTADEVRELRTLGRDYLDERRDRTADDHPEGARRVRITRIYVPAEVPDEPRTARPPGSAGPPPA